MLQTDLCAFPNDPVTRVSNTLWFSAWGSARAATSALSADRSQLTTVHLHLERSSICSPKLANSQDDSETSARKSTYFFLFLLEIPG